MEGEPPSMCVLNASELFPLGPTILDEPELQIPFTPLTGESVKYVGRVPDGLLGLSNYRLHLTTSSEERSVPLGLIDQVEIRDLFQLMIYCKDVRVVKCSFSTSEQCSEWSRRVTISITPPTIIEGFFAFPFHAWAAQWSRDRNHELNSVVAPNEWLPMLRKPKLRDDFKFEIERLQFDLRGAWRITQANADNSLCPTYPKQLIVPACISDDALEAVGNFRGSRRIPVVVWRHRGNGAILARCSQPEVGWLGWRCTEDEQLIKALSDACSCDRGSWSNSDSPTPPSSPEGSHEEVAFQESKKVLIVDARSYTSAVTNRARGGGCECAEYYFAEIQFMSMGNIHVIRKSFQALRLLCASPADCANWLSVLERTHWLQHLASLLRASSLVVRALHKAGRPVLVHCSDGWDRTPQICATAQLCLDPFYRTIEGFRILVEREWLNFGHKFADRSGHQPGNSDVNERCPVFLQWLDAVHQLIRQFPCSFEFSMAYLIKIAQHSHTCLFGTFLCNSDAERATQSVPERTFSVWPFLENPAFRNHLYVYNKEVLWPEHNVRDLVLWSEVYLSSLEGRGEGRNSPGDGANNTDVPTDLEVEVAGVMIKTRSYGDLLSAGGTSNPAGLNFRRSSDPNVIVDTIKLNDLALSCDASVDTDNSETENEILSITHNHSENIQNQNNKILLCTTINNHANVDQNHILQNIILHPNEESKIKNSLDMVDTFINNINQRDDCEELNSNNRSCDIMKVNAISTSNKLQLTNGDSGDTNVICVKNNNCDNVNETNIEQKQNGTLNGSDDDKDSITATEDDSFSNDPSVETSTDTLVPHPVDNDRMSNGQVVDVQWPFSECGTSGRNSQYSTPSSRGFSRAPSAPPASSPGFPITPPWPQVSAPASTMDSIDGLGHGINEEGLRLQQLVFEHKMREDALKKELQSARMAMMRHLCQQCYPTRNDIPDRADESSSLTDSVGASGASDCSWEAVEDRPGYIHGPGGVLWVPDHAVSRCTGCDTQFWLGRRKHHCRSCGCIFCADCAEHYAPLPTENLYTPVRLCTPCYHKQSAMKSQLAEACKNAASDTRALVNTRPPIGTPTN